MADGPVELIALEAGPLRLELAPARGGSIVRFHMAGPGGGASLMRPGDTAALTQSDPRALAAFPLFPFSGRIADGIVTFGDGTEVIPNSWPGGRHPIHGDAWLEPWSVEHADGASAVLVYEHDGTGWPVRYRARQAFRLSEQGLSLELDLENVDWRSMPAGIGVHPYFLKTPETRLQARSGHVWLTDHELIPLEQTPVPADWDFSEGRRLGSLVLDNCFGEWGGTAVITWPEWQTRLRISAEAPLGHLVVFTPKDRDFFCVEPVSHAAGGFALAERGVAGTGTRHLGPGEHLSARIRFEPSRIA
jgi:aldose 1-epimerase